jgi:hypothetical protein
MDQLPALTGIFFVLTTALTILIFHGASYFSKTVLRVLLIWLGLQAVLAIAGFYILSDFIPLRFLIQLLPIVLFIFGVFNTLKGKLFIDSLDLPALTLLHVIRIPLELVLFWLFFYQDQPSISIFELRNLYLLSGLTAPVMLYRVFIKNNLSKKALLIWNFTSMTLLLTTVVYAVLAAPLPYAYIDSQQPNVAVLYFPFLWMSCCIVPLVLLSHLAAIRLILRSQPAYPSFA